MTKVTRLTEYMEVICNRPYMQNEHHVMNQNKSNAIRSEFEDLLFEAKDTKARLPQRKVKNDKLSAFIKQYAIPLYAYAYRIKILKIVKTRKQMKELSSIAALIIRHI